ncbi:MAG TPA: hypothetical protein VE093_24520 [Polyangiaceae bacterium]|nr:hypothetical protein [Polyangiaceae bacterium]
MESDRPSQPPLLGAPLPVQLRRVGDRLLVELAPEGQRLIASAIQVAAAARIFDSCVALARSFTVLADAQLASSQMPRGEPTEPHRQLPKESPHFVSYFFESALEAFAREQKATLEELQNEHSDRLREAALSAHTLTPEELEADQALCAMLGIDPDDLPDDRLSELRKLWV